MSVLVVGLSHKSAPVATLERAAVSGDALGKLLCDVAQLPDIAEAFVISTCNRVEVYTEVHRFHGAVTGVCELLARYSGIQPGELTGSLYVHYEDRAVQHLLAVASGLDSMVVGEDQILGQVRTALKDAADRGTLGRTLRDLGRLALRAGKRARAETGIDRLGVSLVSVGIELATSALGAPEERAAELASDQLLSGLDVLVVGAGAMSGLAVATAARSGAAHIVVANRTREHADRLASGVGGEVADLASLTDAIAAADLVISCTGASGLVISEPVVRAAAGRREARPLVLLDLAMPHDVDRAVRLLPGVTVIGLDELRDSGGVAVGAGEMAAVRAIVEEEYAAYGSAVRAARVTPTVVALRAKAATVVDSELARLAGRLSEDGLSGRTLEEIAQTVRRVVDKLLHAPTVRVKELASSPGGEEYAAALRVLFDIDPRAVEAVTRAEVEPPNAADQEGLSVKAGLTSPGDACRDLTQIGGPGVFASALRESLLRGEVDFAVHSLEELPAGAAPAGAHAVQWPALMRPHGPGRLPPAATHSDGLDAAATGATMVVREHGAGNGADAARSRRELATDAGAWRRGADMREDRQGLST